MRSTVTPLKMEGEGPGPGMASWWLSLSSLMVIRNRMQLHCALLNCA
uniref:Uncharacterized protein n=1 Tax=Arundo donax TaxID=35708 RepID=A0A0A9C819_ARUDO